MREYFKAIDVDPSEAKGLFRLLDIDSSDALDAEEFLGGCLRLRGPAKALDVALLMHEVKNLNQRFHAHFRFLECLLNEAVGADLDPLSPDAEGGCMSSNSSLQEVEQTLTDAVDVHDALSMSSIESLPGQIGSDTAMFGALRTTNNFVPSDERMMEFQILRDVALGDCKHTQKLSVA